MFVLRNYPIMGSLYMLLLPAVLAIGVYFSGYDRSKFGMWLSYLGLIQAVIAIFQVCGVHLLFTPREAWAQNLATGLMGHNTVLGPFLVCCFAPALWQRRYLTASVLFLAAALSDSSMTYASLGFVLWAYYWHRSGPKMAAYSAYLGFTALCLIYALFPSLGVFGLSGRAHIWAQAVTAWKSAWLFGHGAGSWEYVLSPKLVGLVGGTMRWPQIHNEYLECLVAFGVALFVPLMLAIGQFSKRFKPTWHHAICGALLINAAGNFTFQIPTLALIFIVSWMYSAQDLS
jgi:hypothetical protein